MSTHARILLVSLFFQTALHSAGQAQQAHDLPNDLEMILSEHEEAREQGKMRLAKQRHEMISRLIAYVEKNAENRRHQEEVLSAIAVLGEMRAVEAVDILARNVAYPYVMVQANGTTRGSVGVTTVAKYPERFPVVKALLQIGQPCVDAVIEKASRTLHPDESLACLTVLRNLDLSSVRARLEHAIQHDKGNSITLKVDDLEVKVPVKDQLEPIRKDLDKKSIKPLSIHKESREELIRKLNEFLREYEQQLKKEQ